MHVDVQRTRWPERRRRRQKWQSIPDAAAAVQEGDLRKIILAFMPR
jgi:hypothetical protein